MSDDLNSTESQFEVHNNLDPEYGTQEARRYGNRKMYKIIKMDLYLLIGGSAVQIIASHKEWLADRLDGRII